MPRFAVLRDRRLTGMAHSQTLGNAKIGYTAFADGPEEKPEQSVRSRIDKKKEEKEKANIELRMKNKDNEEAYAYLGVTSRLTDYSGGRTAD